MKKILFLVFVFCCFVVFSAPIQVVPDPTLGTPTQSLYNVRGNASGAMYVHVLDFATPLSASASYYITVNSVPAYRSYQPVFYPVSLSSTTGVLLSSVVTLTFPCVIEVGSNEGDIYCGTPTTVAATIKTQGRKLLANNFWRIEATGTFDLGLVAASGTSNASAVIVVFPQK